MSGVYTVPVKIKGHFNEKYFSAIGENVSFETVECSNKLVFLVAHLRIPLYVDLMSGDVVSGYRPGSEAIKVNNLVSFMRSRGYDVCQSNLIYWIEALSFDEIGIYELEEKLTENPRAESFLRKVLLSEEGLLDNELTNNLMVGCEFLKAFREALKSRPDWVSYYQMIGYSSSTGDPYLTRIMSYLRARNRDFNALYCRELDSYYIDFAKRVGIGEFNNYKEIISELRSLYYRANPEIVDILRACDFMECAKMCDFALDLEKMGRMIDKIT